MITTHEINISNKKKANERRKEQRNLHNMPFKNKAETPRSF